MVTVTQDQEAYTAVATEEADALFRAIVHESIYLGGDHGIPHKDVPVGTSVPELARLREGRAFYHRHYASCVGAVVTAVCAQFPVERITTILTRNESYNTPQFIVLRAAGTFMYLNLWFKEGIEDKLSQSSQDVLKIRKVHEVFAKKLGEMPVPPPKKPKRKRPELLEAVRKDFAHIPTPDYLRELMTPNPKVPISQFDMLMIHGVFFFVLDVNPKLVGLHTDKGYEDYVYYIGIIGRLLGIEDRFNLALLPNSAVRKTVSKRLWEEVIIPCFKTFNEDNFDKLCYFMEVYGPGTLEGAAYIVIRDVLGIQPAENMERHVNWIYKLARKIVLSGTSLMKYGVFRWIANTTFKMGHRGAFGVLRVIGLRNPATRDIKVSTTDSHA